MARVSHQQKPNGVELGFLKDVPDEKNVPDLIFFKRLFKFLQIGQMSNVTSNLLDGASETRQSIRNSGIDLSRICLGADRIAF